MKTKTEVDEFKTIAANDIVYKCKKCKGIKLGCSCMRDYEIIVSAFEACIPRDFWDVKQSDITGNREAFENGVLKYTRKMKLALHHGYGMMLMGDNGVGKTIFMSYILMSAIKKGMTSYYTTLPQLDFDIKRGFDSSELKDRLDWMLTSDFLALDEMGKERMTSPGDRSSFINTHVERILKHRFDNSMPVVLSTNMSMVDWVKVYGTTLSSIIIGKYKQVNLKHGDFRKNLASDMDSKMGYDG